MNIENGIYCYKDKETGKIIYIGKDSYIGKNKRYKDYMASYNYDKQYINMELQDNFDEYEYEILIKGKYDQNQLINLENYYIEKYNPQFNLRIVEDKNLCNERGVDGMFLIDYQEIIVADRNDKGVLCHEISHYLYSIGSSKYFDSILDICALLDIDFWDVVNVAEVSEMVDDYEVFMDEILAYFMESIYNEFPEVVLESHPVYRIFLK